jgi:glycosyltransferase involved in cell wall biosynthesis
MARVTFVMEQHLGHQTYYRNLRAAVDDASAIQATWADVHYTAHLGLFENMPLPGGLRGSFRGLREVRSALQASSSDIFFFNTQVPAILGGRLTHQRPYVISTDITPLQYDAMSLHYGHRPDRPGPLALYKHLTNVQVLQKAAALVPWSTWTRDSLIRDYGVAPEKIEVVPPGVDLNRWQPINRAPNNELHILFVGGDLERKGGTILLEAFRRLPTGVAKLILVTRTKIPTEAGVEVYNDLQPNDPMLIELYQRSDVFVIPTRAEAFGIAAVEASAAGLPVIATAVGGLTDIVIDKQTGFLIPVDDVVALTVCLQQLLDQHLRQQMGRMARVRAEQYFNADVNAKRVIHHLLHAAKPSFRAHTHQ